MKEFVFLNARRFEISAVLDCRNDKSNYVLSLIFLVANSAFGFSIFTILVDIYNTILSIHRKDELGSK